MTRPTTVLLADDHVVVAQGIASLLKDHGFDVIGTVGDGASLIEQATQLRPDVIVTDITMPGLSGLEVLDRLKAVRPDTKVIVLTMHDDPAVATRALRAGARAYLLKYAAGHELVGAIQDVLMGRVYISPAVTRGVMERMQSPEASSGPRLTARQREVLRLVVDGHRMKEIAAMLNLSPRTVETHKYELMQALGVHSTVELIRYVLENDVLAD